VVLGLAVGFAWGGCEANTFVCGYNLAPGGEYQCICKADARACGDMGECLAGCPVP